ncbi:DUF397 domain-containing protein [Streptomyces albicerus]|uniref:DUF397 domain-containing protein n=1 Tax=Streptomyces albicerus TaxID=2569859 RepID=UPI001CED28A2|nr:DUF397 domain-containing protein [Streptomyces albicerus]
MEMADAFPGFVPVRDRKVPHGPAVTFKAGSWASFTGKLRSEWRPSPIPQTTPNSPRHRSTTPPLHPPNPPVAARPGRGGLCAGRPPAAGAQCGHVPTAG